jgi:hypothetical protein
MVSCVDSGIAGPEMRLMHEKHAWHAQRLQAHSPLVFEDLLLPSLPADLSFEDGFFFSGSLSFVFFSFFATPSAETVFDFLSSPGLSFGAIEWLLWGYLIKSLTGIVRWVACTMQNLGWCYLAAIMNGP